MIKKLTWYDMSHVPPRRTEKNGNLTLVIENEGRAAEGFYSHEEEKFYVYAKRYYPKPTKAAEIIASVQEVNDSLVWDEQEAKGPTRWILLDK